MPDGAGTRGGRTGQFFGPGFRGRRLPARRFPRFFFFPADYSAPQRRCDYIDRFGRCCDRSGRCHYGEFDDSDYDDFYDDVYDDDYRDD